MNRPTFRTITRFGDNLEGDNRLDLLSRLEPSPEEIQVVLVDESLIEEAEAVITACGACSEAAELSLDYVLDALTDSDPSVTEYLLKRLARCPRCRSAVTEKTVVLF